MLSRFRLLLLLLTIAGWQLSAAPRLVRAESIKGRYYETTNRDGVDTIFIFKSVNDAQFSTVTGQYAKWTDVVTGDSCDQTNVFQNLTDGHCYRATTDKDTTHFVFIDYTKHSLDSSRIKSINLDCQQTTILYDSLTMKYYTPQGTQTVYPYKIALKYDNQEWDSTALEWKDIEVIDTVEIDGSGAIVLNKNLKDTRFTFEEPIISNVLNNGNNVTYTSDTLTAVAVEQRLQYYITKRGSMQENEKEGPYGTENLKATVVHSAPIDVLFEAHPSAKADVYNWTIKKGQTVVTARNDKDIRYTFDEVSESAPEYYYVNLVVRNSEHTACTDTGKVDFELHSSMLMVPNVFTPNGDGVNDEFRVAYRSICEFHCWVYNRWQHLVYQWDDPAKGWDGTYNGRKEPDSAYIYIIEAKGCDGQKYKLKGTVNLLRGK